MPSTLSCIEINPECKSLGSVIWLHGLGADGNDFVPIVSEFKLAETCPLRFVFPNAPMIPVTLNYGYVMRAWYDIFSLDKIGPIDEKGILQSVENLKALIEKEEQAGIPTESIVLAGFSQGAVIALITALTFSKPLAGVIALSGYFPLSEKILQQASPTNHSTPIFVAHGREDSVIPFTQGLMIYSLLTKHHYPVTFHEYAMAHSVCVEEINDIAKWLEGVFK